MCVYCTEHMYQSTGQTNHSNGTDSCLGNVKQVVQECLVLMVGKQVKLVKNKHNALIRATSWKKEIRQTRGT